MACQLGFDNKYECGGTYTGKDMGKKLGEMYQRLVSDGYIDSEAESGPLISLQISKEKPKISGLPQIGADQPLFLYQLFGNDKDNMMDSIDCSGITDEPEATCKSCPYYQG